ncbi:TetR family transcriptional regulator [Lentzea sp. NPDC051838]|uniref:TetR/AcrR family transcriptional regulator n=1 Tax=Lentzea sp. NPDC051838 TaxID=3154849 RepID=UPI003413BDC5
MRGLGAAHDERRAAILEAVFAIVDAEGTHQVSIRRVAERAGVSVGRVQHYFPSKDELLSAAFTAINDRGTARVQARLADASSPLEAVLTELIPESEEDRRLFRVAQAFETHALTNSVLSLSLKESYDDLLGLLAALGGGPELLALALGLANLTLTGNLTAAQARAIIRSGIEKRG